MSMLSALSRSTLFLLVIAGLAISGCTSSGTSTSNSPQKNVKEQGSKPTKTAALKQRPSEINQPIRGKVTRTGEVYLLRGLANVFSRGMDTMGVRFVKSGVDARVYNHAAWRDLADNIILRSKKKQVSYPIIIMGHSLGANAAVLMARYLGDNGIKVQYVVAFDPTIPTSVGKNVRQVTNYYIPNDSRSNTVRKAAGFRGTLKNINVTNMAGVTHMNVEKNYSLQSKSIKRAISLTKKRRNRRS